MAAIHHAVVPISDVDAVIAQKSREDSENCAGFASFGWFSDGVTLVES